MRIAMIGQKGLPAHYGGIEKHVEMLSLELVKQGHTVLAYARHWYTPQNITDYRGITVIHQPTIHTKHLDAIVHTFLSTLNAIKQKVDIIHYHGVGPALLSFLPRLLSPRTKVVVTFHCIDRYHKKWNFLARWFLLLGEFAACYFPHATIVVSRVLYNYCLNEFGKNTVLITNGVAPQTGGNPNELQAANLTPNKYVAFASRLVAHKGAHYLISAWQQARAEQPSLFSDYQLAIAGDSVFTDSYVQHLKQLVGNDDSIVMPGWLNGAMLDAFFANCYLFVQPSENEGMSLSVLKAMANGRPVLVSDIPENREIVPDERFWFANADVTALKNKLINLFQHEAWLTEAGQKNKRLATAEYGWEKIAIDTEKVFSDLITQPPAALAISKNLP